MKFRNPAARQMTIPGDLQVESLGRFGNYFFATGWIEGFDGVSGTCEYRLPGIVKPLTPEFTFERTDDGRTSFLHLFWHGGGGDVLVGPDQPAQVAWLDERENPLRRQPITELRDGDFETLLTAVEMIDDRRAWPNRVVLEIINHCGIDDRSGFFAVAMHHAGWPALNEGTLQRLHGADECQATRGYLRFLCDCVTSMDTRYLPGDLKEAFVGTVGKLRIGENDRELCRDVVRELSRFEPDLARGFALAVISELPHDRDDFAELLRPCFPLESQWWIHHALANEELGPEQIADALNCAGTAAAAQGEDALAMLCFETGLRIDPEAQSIAWNAAWFWNERGDQGRAASYFQQVTRHFPDRTISTMWPKVKGRPWPAQPADPSGFELPAGVSEWPRISVVTPSYNQGHFIEETILSILHQGYPNLQYIVVDGNSTDDTREVLERYRDRIDHLIIEPDDGQTEAINKGLRLADGEIVTWLNSDDMYAPGALHAAALKWLETRADVIAGICIEHTDRRMRLLNKPAASNADFNLPQLARIFDYWLKGYFFYQPEIFFSKTILDKAGLLDESLYYSMDYDLWVRFAREGATLETLHWPVAFFRKHEAQKTTDLVDCVEEQCRVRDRYHPIVTCEQRDHRIRRTLRQIGRQETVSVGVLTRRIGKIFSQNMQAELDRFCGGRIRCHLGADETHPGIADADIVILLAHVLEDDKTIGNLRAARPDRPIAAWFWDNHHHMFENRATAEAVDIVLPGHAVYSEYLRSDRSIHGGHVPLCITQWTRQDAEAWFKEYGGTARNSELLVDIEWTPDDGSVPDPLRSQLDRIPHQIPAPDLAEGANHPSDRDRFRGWCGYRVSLPLLRNRALSHGVFDALLAGQIPLVPEEVADLDAVIPPELQQTLPVVRFSMKDPDGAIKAYQRALDAFAEGGPDEALARHRHALAHHGFSTRIDTILKTIGSL